MATIINPERLGRPFLNAAAYWKGFYRLLGYILKNIGALNVPPVRQVFYRQVYFTGIEALWVVSLIAALSGVVIAGQITSLAGPNSPFTAKIMLWMLVRELGPLLTAIVIIARSSSAMASELASMKIRGEADSLRMMGVDVMDYLVVPRIAGMTLSVVATTFYFQMTAIVMGFAFVAAVQDVPFLTSMEGVLSILDLTEVLVSLLKAFVFGLVISVTSCYYGLSAPRSVTAIPRAATRAVMQNLVSVFFLDGIITYAFFL